MNLQVVSFTTDGVSNDAGVGDGVNKRSAMLVAAGLMVSLATGSVAFMNGILGPAAGAITSPPAAQRQGRVEASALRVLDHAGSGLAFRRVADPAPSTGLSNDD